MKLQSYNVLKNSQDLQDMLQDIQDILNLGLYQVPEIVTAPTDSPTEGESRVYYSGTDKRVYFFINGAWVYTTLRSEQVGWGYIAEAAATSVTKAVTFGTAFAAAPIVLISYIGSRLISAGTPTDPSWFTGALTLRSPIAYAASTTGFTAGIIQTANTNLDATYNSGFTWRAIIT